MEGEERDENAETDQQHQEDVALRVSGNRRGRFLQNAEIEAARGFRHAAIKHDQAKQQNETSRGQIDRDFPRGGLPVAGSPDSDEQESGDQGELVKGVEEKEIDRSECSHGAAGNEEEAGVEGMFVFGDFAREPDGGERYDRGEDQHHQAQAIDAEGEIDPPIAADREGGDELKTTLPRFEAAKYSERGRRDGKTGGPHGGAPGRGAEQNRERRHNWAKDDEKQDHRKSVK